MSGCCCAFCCMRAFCSRICFCWTVACCTPAGLPATAVVTAAPEADITWVTPGAVVMILVVLPPCTCCCSCSLFICCCCCKRFTCCCCCCNRRCCSKANCWGVRVLVVVVPPAWTKDCWAAGSVWPAETVEHFCY